MANFISPKTRKHSCCPVFGAPRKFSEALLPTYEDLMKHYLLERVNLKPTRDAKEPTVRDISEKSATVIERIWRKASIPIISHTRVLQLIRAYHDSYRKLLKSCKGRKNEDGYKAKLLAFRNESKKKLFDIASCKCVRGTCSCSKERKVPVDEEEFLSDQRTVRLMCISGVDQCKTRKLVSKLKRKALETERIEKRRKSLNEIDNAVSTMSSSEYDNTESDSTEVDSDSDDCDSEVRLSVKSREVKEVTNNKTIGVVSGFHTVGRDLPALARTCDRYGVSDRSAAAIASAVLEDVGLITENNYSIVIDKNKVRRQRRKARTELQQSQTQNELRGLFFDGRKDQTLTNKKEGRTFYRKTVVEEHISLISEPGSSYLGHTSPSSGTAKDITKSIVDFLTIGNISTENLQAIGCDGTAVNTGLKGGVIRLLEEQYDKPLQWLICQLHANELPLRHLVESLDGSTSGPRGFTGPIGKQLSKCEQLPLTNFNRILGDLPTIESNDLSTDQKYLLEMSQAVSSGKCSPELSKRDPGKLNHSRWLTTANRILRLYVASDEPSMSLVSLVTYIIKVYVPVWFSIKFKPSCKDGAVHLFHLIELSRYLPEDLRSIVDPVIQRNGFFGHPENILLSMITDNRRHIRELGLRRIMKTRTKESTPTALRRFTVPQLNFDAKEYVELINWQDVEVTEPPLTLNISDDAIKLFVANGSAPIIDFPRFPCHTQAVERCVKLVTESSSNVCGAEARDGFIRTRVAARAIMPCFNTKANYCVQPR